MMQFCRYDEYCEQIDVWKILLEQCWNFQQVGISTGRAAFLWVAGSQTPPIFVSSCREPHPEVTIYGS